MNFLDEMIRNVRMDVERRAREKPVVIPRLRGERLSLLKAIESAPHVPVIAEIKRASPSHGIIREGGSAPELAREMVEGGAVGISVLAEERYFGGSPEAVGEVRKAINVPVLYKSLVVHEYQLLEAAAAGADAVLLMVSVLGPETGRFVRMSRELGMETVVEIGSEHELGIGISAGADMIGVNNRDMRTMRVDLNRTARLARQVPDGCVLISESGISGPEDVRRVMDAGADAVLVGTAIMRSGDVRGFVRSLVMAR